MTNRIELQLVKLADGARCLREFQESLSREIAAKD